MNGCPHVLFMKLSPRSRHLLVARPCARSRDAKIIRSQATPQACAVGCATQEGGQKGFREEKMPVLHRER